MVVVESSAQNPMEAIDILEYHFLDERAKRVNGEVWLELNFDFVKPKRSLHGNSVDHEGVLEDLLS